MATRFYLPNTYSALAPGSDSSWDITSGSAVRALITGSLTTTAYLSVQVAEATASTVNVKNVTFVSNPLLDGIALSGSIKGILRAMESINTADMQAQMVVRLWDGNTFLSLLTSSTAALTGSEFNNSFANRKFPLNYAGAGYPLTTQTTRVGDRLVVEIGYRSLNSTATSRNATLEIGYSASYSDLAEDETSTNQFNPWVEFSQNLTFLANATVSPTGVAASSSVGTATVTIPSVPDNYRFYSGSGPDLLYDVNPTGVTGVGPWTVGAWIKPTNVHSGGGIGLLRAGNFNTASVSRGFQFGIKSSGVLTARLSNSEGIDGVTIVPTGSWSRVGATRAGAGIANVAVIYNGVQDGITNTDPPTEITTGDAFQVSFKDNVTSQAFWDGGVAWVFYLSGTALSATALDGYLNNPQSLITDYGSSGAVKPNALKIFWPMQCNGGSTETDKSGVGNDGTYSGSLYVTGGGPTPTTDWNPCSAVSSSNASIYPSGSAVSSSIGSVTVQANAIDAVSGVSVSSSVGGSTLQANTVTITSGVSVSSSIGPTTLQANGNVTVSGVEASSSVGTVTIQANANVTVSGVEAASSVGTVTVTAISNTALVNVTGVVASSSIGTVTSRDSALLSTTVINPSLIQWTNKWGSVSASLQSPTGQGNLIAVLVVTVASSSVVTSVKDNASNAYTQVTNAIGVATDAAGWRTDVWYAKNSLPGATVVSIATGSINNVNSTWVLEFTNIDTTSPFDSASIKWNSGNNILLSSSVVNTINPTTLVLSLVAGNSGRIIGLAPNDPFTLVGAAVSGSSGVAYRTVNQTGSYAAVWSQSLASEYLFSTVAFKSVVGTTSVVNGSSASSSVGSVTLTNSTQISVSGVAASSSIGTATVSLTSNPWHGFGLDSSYIYGDDFSSYSGIAQLYAASLYTVSGSINTSNSTIDSSSTWFNQSTGLTNNTLLHNPSGSYLQLSKTYPSGTAQSDVWLFNAVAFNSPYYNRGETFLFRIFVDDNGAGTTSGYGGGANSVIFILNGTGDYDLSVNVQNPSGSSLISSFVTAGNVGSETYDGLPTTYGMRFTTVANGVRIRLYASQFGQIPQLMYDGNFTNASIAAGGLYARSFDILPYGDYGMPNPFRMLMWETATAAQNPYIFQNVSTTVNYVPRTAPPLTFGIKKIDPAIYTDDRMLRAYFDKNSSTTAYDAFRTGSSTNPIVTFGGGNIDLLTIDSGTLDPRGYQTFRRTFPDLDTTTPQATYQFGLGQVVDSVWMESYYLTPTWFTTSGSGPSATGNGAYKVGPDLPVWGPSNAGGYGYNGRSDLEWANGSYTPSASSGITIGDIPTWASGPSASVRIGDIVSGSESGASTGTEFYDGLWYRYVQYVGALTSSDGMTHRVWRYKIQNNTQSLVSYDCVVYKISASNAPVPQYNYVSWTGLNMNRQRGVENLYMNQGVVSIANRREQLNPFGVPSGDLADLPGLYTASISVTANPLGVFTSSSIGTVTVVATTGSFGATVNPSGVAASSSIGTVVVQGSANEGLSSVVASSSIGTVSLRDGVTVTITGVSVSSSIGSVTISVLNGVTVSPSGVSVSSSIGSISVFEGSTVTPTGASVSSSIGTVSVRDNSIISSSGVSVSSSVGSVTVTANSSIIPNGVSTSSSIGTVQIVANAVDNLSGVSVTSTVGSIQPQGNAKSVVTGVSISSSVGAVTTNASANKTLSGVAGSLSVGNVALQNNANDYTTGVSVSSSLGTVTVSTPLPNYANVNVSGVSLTPSIGSVVIYAQDSRRNWTGFGEYTKFRIRRKRLGYG